MLRTRRKSSAGFSLVEVLMVIAVIGIMAAVAIPNIITWVRTSKIRGAAQEVAAEINTARLKAITKNVNEGVVFLVVSDNTYRYVIEDDLNPQDSNDVSTMTVAETIAVPDQADTLRTLPDGVVFQPGGNSGVRFDRLGAACAPGSSTDCPALGTGYNAVTINASSATAMATVTLYQATTQMTRTIRVASGGRVFVVQ